MAAVGIPLVISAAYLSAGARMAAGAPMLPLDDSYIHLQYAWQASRGQFLQYNPGETPTSGATSLLYMLLIALGFVAGISHAAMPAAALVFGALLFAMSTVVLAELARRVARWQGISENLLCAAAIILFGGSGWMAWAFLSGMETGLLITLVIVAVWASVTRRIRLMAVAGALAALTRPEAALLPLALLIAELAFPERPGGGGSGAPGRAHAARWLAVALAAVAVSPSVNYFYTGSFSASGTQAKSLFSMVPFQWSAVWAAFSASMLEIWARLFGGQSSDGHWQAFPLLQLFAAGGAVLLSHSRAGPLSRSPAGRRLALVCVAWSVLGAASAATLQTALWHHYRYLMPYYPVLLLLGGIGFVQVISKWIHGARAVRLAALALLAVWSVYSIGDFRNAYARDSQTAAEMQLALAGWLHGNTPANSRVAVHDAGILRYFGNNVTIDVVGLTTAAKARAYRNGPGSIFESLEYSRPDYYMVYPYVAPPYYGISSAAQLLGRELFRVQVKDYSAYTSAGDTQVITEPDWSRVGLADVPQQPSIRALLHGLSLVDAVDVGDLNDEKLHSYSWWNVGEPAGFPTDARVQTYREDPNITLADGGRLLNGGQAFVLTVRPGVPLTLIARVHQTADMVLNVNVNGAGAGLWRLPAVAGQWLESAFTIGPDLLAGPTAQVRLTFTERPAAAAFSPFHYWAYQGPVVNAPASPQHSLEAAFGSTARLVGIDVPESTLAPGQTLPLTLYWMALQPDHVNYKVFIHLMNPANDTPDGIVAQADEAPRKGTYPFWVWPAGATVRQDLKLDIPSQTPPGQYLLLGGVYNPDTGERLAIVGAADYGSNRLKLAVIAIQ